jgi:hypothetical protein
VIGQDELYYSKSEAISVIVNTLSAIPAGVVVVAWVAYNGERVGSYLK